VPATKIDAVVFDLGGVLLDWNPRHLYRQIFADPAEMETFLGTICTQQWHLAHDLGADITLSCQQLALQHPSYAPQIMAWAERTEEMVAGQLDDSVELLAELRRAELRCYVLSNMEAPCFEVRLGRFGFLHWFDGHVISGQERVAKPDRRIFRILLARYGLNPQTTIFIDDSEANIAAARKLGMIAIRFTSARQLRRDLRLAGLDWPDSAAASMAEAAEPPHHAHHWHLLPRQAAGREPPS
jgi:2-haloacid dehalogenase